MAYKKHEELVSKLTEQGIFILPFASSKDFVKGKAASFSVNLLLIQTIGGIEEIYIIEGGIEQNTLEALQFEQKVLERLSVK